MNEPRHRLKAIREQSGKLPAEIAAQAEISLASYCDCEQGDDLKDVISLRELQKICSALGIQPVELFSNQRPETTGSISFDEIVSGIKAFLEREKISLPEFEDMFGFRMEAVLRDSSEIWEWSVDWLQQVSKTIGIDWLAALPKESLES